MQIPGRGSGRPAPRVGRPGGVPSEGRRRPRGGRGSRPRPAPARGRRRRAARAQEASADDTDGPWWYAHRTIRDATGERASAESAARAAADPSNLIWIMPAQGVEASVTARSSLQRDARRLSLSGRCERREKGPMRAVIVAGGDVAPGDLDLIDPGDLVLAADGGAVPLMAAGFR